MAHTTELTLSLEAVEPAEARDLATELGEYLRSEDAGLVIELRRADPARQDLGAVLLVIAGTAAAEAIANGVRAWLAKRGGARVRARSDKGEIQINNASSADVDALSVAIERLME
jgi:hypothetical protein